MLSRGVPGSVTGSVFCFCFAELWIVELGQNYQLRGSGLGHLPHDYCGFALGHCASVS